MTHPSIVPSSAASHTQTTPRRLLRYLPITSPKAPKSRRYFNPEDMPVSAIPLSYDKCESDKERVKGRRPKKDLEVAAESLRGGHLKLPPLPAAAAAEPLQIRQPAFFGGFQKEPFVQLDPDDEDQDLFWTRKKPMD
ncbi:hypothetical protein ACEPPN_005451 [Leptodophora sp. 'Broadleaf-Isolate-01']